MFILSTVGRCGCTFSESRMDADRGGGSTAVSGSSFFMLHSLYVPQREEALPDTPQIFLREHTDLCWLYLESQWCKPLTPVLMFHPTSKAHGKQDLTLGVGFTAGSTACHFTFLSAYLLSKWSCVPTGLANVPEIILQKCWERILWGSVLRISSHGSSHGPSMYCPWLDWCWE